MSGKYKSIQIKTETYEELAKMGSVADSFDSVISSLLKKSRLLQSDSGTSSDRIATSIMNQPTGQEEHNYG